jgi:hypothetical protein
MLVKQSISTYSVTKFKKSFMSKKMVRIFTTRLKKVKEFAFRDFKIILVLWIRVLVYVHHIKLYNTNVILYITSQQMQLSLQ